MRQPTCPVLVSAAHTSIPRCIGSLFLSLRMLRTTTRNFIAVKAHVTANCGCTLVISVLGTIYRMSMHEHDTPTRQFGRLESHETRDSPQIFDSRLCHSKTTFCTCRATVSTGVGQIYRTYQPVQCDAALAWGRSSYFLLHLRFHGILTMDTGVGLIVADANLPISGTVSSSRSRNSTHCAVLW